MNVFHELGRNYNYSLNKDFPSLRNYYNYRSQLGSMSEDWVSTTDLWKLFILIPPLNNCLHKQADLLSMGLLQEFIKINGKLEEIHDTEELEFFKNPNPLQTYEQFVKQYSIYFSVYGNAFFYKLRGLNIEGKLPDAMWNLPPDKMKVCKTGKIFNQTDINKIISCYEMEYAGATVEYNTDDIIFKNENLGSDYIIGESKLISLTKPLSNIVAVMQTANKLTVNHGTFGFITNRSKDALGSISMSDSERKRLESKHNVDYGNLDGQHNLTFTTNDIDYIPIGYKIRDMMLNEILEKYSGFVYDAFGMNRSLFASDKGTGNNSGGAENIALKHTFQNSTIPSANDLTRTLTYGLGLNKQNKFLKMSYSHLDALQENRKEKEYATQVRINSIAKAVEAKLITLQTGQELAALELKN